MQEIWSIKRILRWTTGFFKERGFSSPRLDAELLIAEALGVDRIRLYLDFNKPLGDPERAAIRERVRRRATGEPVAYILGERGFWSLDLKVDPRALIPRPETELLVEQGLLLLKQQESPLIVDVGTGSGCIALALAKEKPEAEIHAIDRSPEALVLAQENAKFLGLELKFHLGDLLKPLGDIQADLILSNPPYIPSAAIKGLMSDVREFEPHIALDGGEDGLELIRRLIQQAPPLLREGGALLMEIGFDQGAAVLKILEADGRYVDLEIHRDHASHERVIQARRGER